MEMNLDTIHPLQGCWDLALASVKARALDAAIQRGIFGFLKNPATAEALAEFGRLDPVNTGHLLDLLWSMGVLTRRAGVGRAWVYGVDPKLAAFLVPGEEGYCGDALAHRLRSLRQFGAQLPGLLGAGAHAPQAPQAAGWAQAAEVQIGQEQGAVTAAAALACVGRLQGLGGARRFLDLGGGPGKVAVALAGAHPQWQGVVFDLPETAGVAQRIILRAGLGQRLESRGGDIGRDRIGAGYDLVWCSSVLHFLPEWPGVIAKIRDALVPGGYFVSVHAELPSERDAAARVLPYYLPLLMRGRRVWPQGAMVDRMRELGFESITSAALSYFPLAPAQVVIGRRQVPRTGHQAECAKRSISVMGCSGDA
ncbi:class I SAM-dependent methyltransferase [Verminephrobacter aporrectodeae subsp. tuberculatae]|uniref:class I SAM-dependent methyltransferase n=1 Tax=Verminephrobacter aporrectodeae TaxID=1110389 RepID=UPI002237F979|nr:class I SAM-dependent methyltransferase [Verminephrobacter aporrectodeae]MCW5221498.1 class I SAM-dependent methyltransferase [Verminephrobacter aporrectodeae subsp. tuberculatae]MCW5290789.1 class I SAM-dependent methyltransferase [Verminephrobacter aporrectodeae subsp. tuberculatae]MCW8207181.1 class I SAM-dependent methyltransferase [Verminephrobacter aporrectodeae subsp. tuberculatae]